LLRPIDLQVVIVKGVDNAQNMSYSQQMMSSAQQTVNLEEQKKMNENMHKVLARDESRNPNVRTSTESDGNKNYYFSGRRKKKQQSVDPYRGKVIDVRL